MRRGWFYWTARPATCAIVDSITGPLGIVIVTLALIGVFLSWLFGTFPARLGAQQAVAFVAFDTAEMYQARRAFVADLAPYIALLAVILIAVGWVQITVGLRPLVWLHDRMGNTWSVEVCGLAGELDGLLDARAADLGRAQMRAGDLAHGLKTPLQAWMGEAARLRAKGADQEAGEIEQIVAAMRRTIDRDLARSRSDLRHTLARILAALRKTPNGQCVTSSADLPDGSWVALDMADLAEALGAVLENAARLAHATVRLTATCTDGTIILQIIDDGQGIPEPQRDRMLARFARLDESGTGMGLAIAAEILRSVGGDIGLFGDGAGGGLCVRLSLPTLTPSWGRSVLTAA